MWIPLLLFLMKLITSNPYPFTLFRRQPIGEYVQYSMWRLELIPNVVLNGIELKSKVRTQSSLNNLKMKSFKHVVTIESFAEAKRISCRRLQHIIIVAKQSWRPCRELQLDINWKLKYY